MNQRKPDQEMLASLARLGLLDDKEDTRFEALTGGVSSDIWKVTTVDNSYCVKKALSKLKVAADWFAPLERNRYEVAWYRLANKVLPGSAPRILGHDDESMLCAMEYLDPADYKLWKNELRNGHASVKHAASTGTRLGLIHARSAKETNLQTLFPRNEIFQVIRLEPYLEATAERHPDLKDQLFELSQRTAHIALTMIHGDISPKNILLGPDGPVFLDAECACIGDPSFDLAFCLNHFLLKCIWTPSATNAFIDCFKAMTDSYLKEVNWEPKANLEMRAASLLPGLFLARVDGKSPVEYITEEKDKEKVRHCARKLLFNPPTKLKEVTDSWIQELSR